MNGELTIIKGIEQGRAKFAYECALRGKRTADYKSYVKKIPALIKNNGLGATLAFIKSKIKKDAKSKKNKDAYHLIYEQITDWLKRDSKNLINLSDNDDLVDKVISLDANSYRAVTIEILAFLNWLRRFAEGLISEDKQNEN